MSGDQYKIYDQHAVYFLTLTIVDWIDLFTRSDYSLIVTDSLNYCIKNMNLEVYSWVIMSNHVHLIVKVGEPFEMSGFLRDFKKFTSKAFIKRMNEINESRKEWMLDRFGYEAKRIGRAKNYKVWKDDNHAIEIADYIAIEPRIDYIHNNPVKALIVTQPEDYYFSSAIDYAGGKGLVEIVKFDG